MSVTPEIFQFAHIILYLLEIVGGCKCPIGAQAEAEPKPGSALDAEIF